MNQPQPRLPYRVLFVCLGNICRSPTAEGIFRALVRDAALDEHFVIDSAGTGSWHIGSPPDRRTQTAARARGLDLSTLRARQVSTQDFHEFDLIIAMDHDNRSALEAMRPREPHRAGEVRLMLEFSEAAAAQRVREVPDPYSGGTHGFELDLDLLEDACRGLLAETRTIVKRDAR